MSLKPNNATLNILQAAEQGGYGVLAAIVYVVIICRDNQHFPNWRQK